MTTICLAAKSLSPADFLELVRNMSVGLAVRYTLFAGAAWLLGYVIFKRAWIRRKIIASFPQSEEVRREILYSASSVVIFAIVGALTFIAVRRGWTQMYWKVETRGTTWFCLSIVCAILLHDTWFYWTHRMMHHRWFFRWFHRVHHLSHNPTPWASYSFAPLEAVMQAAIFPLTAFLIPIHPYAFAIFMVWQITFNVIGHTGYEFHPHWLMKSPLRFIVNTPTNHIMHHEKMRGNYGLYFNFWDRLMGTNHKDYEDRFREVTSRKGDH